MIFIKHVCRIPLRMTEEELLIGDDAIHGEEAYCFADEDISGPVPSAETEARATLRISRMGAEHKDHAIIEGRDVEEGGSNGSGSGRGPAKDGEAEIKLD